jgi:hypothetical protein
MVRGRVIWTDNPIVFGLSDRMASDLADLGVVVPPSDRVAKKEPKPMPQHVAWKPTPGDTEPPF